MPVEAPERADQVDAPLRADPEIDQRHRRLVRPRECPRGRGGRRDVHRVAAVAEVVLAQAQQREVVIDDEQRAVHRRRASGGDVAMGPSGDRRTSHGPTSDLAEDKRHLPVHRQPAARARGSLVPGTGDRHARGPGIPTREPLRAASAPRGGEINWVRVSDASNSHDYQRYAQVAPQNGAGRTICLDG